RVPFGQSPAHHGTETARRVNHAPLERVHIEVADHDRSRVPGRVLGLMDREVLVTAVGVLSCDRIPAPIPPVSLAVEMDEGEQDLKSAGALELPNAAPAVLPEEAELVVRESGKDLEWDRSHLTTLLLWLDPLLDT